MERIKRAYETLTPESAYRLCDILECSRKSGAQAVVSKLLSFDGLDRVLRSLSESDLKLFIMVVSATDGASYSEIEKHLHLNSNQIDEAAARLKDNLLIFVLKNRKHLNNKLDRIHPFQPVSQLLNLVLDKGLVQQLNWTIVHNAKKAKITDEQILFLQKTRSSGHILSLTEFQKMAPGKKGEQLLDSMIAAELVRVFHLAGYPFTTLLSFKPDNQPQKKPGHKTFPTIKNGYLLLNNLLLVYDAISTWGLFLTQQNKFRKVDWKRISDNTIPPFDLDGRELSHEETAQLAIFAHCLLKTVSLKKDNVFITINPLRQKIYSPEEILRQIVNRYRDYQLPDEVFAPPFAIPSHADIQRLVGFFDHNQTGDEEVLWRHFLQETLHVTPLLAHRLETERTSLQDGFNKALRLLVIMGMLDYTSGEFNLSGIGKLIYNHAHDTNEQAAPRSDAYINSDFSFMLPRESIPDNYLYIILAFTEIIKNDVVLSVRVTRESILKAYKRGMDVDTFISVIERCAKNDIPQNLSFLVRDWIEQTLAIELRFVTVLRASHTSFLDELSKENDKELIKERISPHYALVPKAALDEIIKRAAKHKAIISIIGDDEEDGD